MSKNKEYEKELGFRNLFKQGAWLFGLSLVVAGALFSVLLIESPNWFNFVGGVLLLVTLTGYFYYKGKHFEVEKDNTGIVLAGVLGIAYFLYGGILVGLLVGPVQYLIGRVRGKRK